MKLEWKKSEEPRHSSAAVRDKKGEKGKKIRKYSQRKIYETKKTQVQMRFNNKTTLKTEINGQID